MGRHFILFMLTSALLFCISNAVKCKWYDHICLGGNGKRSAIGQSDQDQQLLKILTQEFIRQPHKRNSFITDVVDDDDDDDAIFPHGKPFDQDYGQTNLSPTIKRLAKLMLPDESQN